MLFTPIATTEELEDKTSWVNAGFEYPIDAYKSYFTTYGEALAAWASVESSLFAIYGYCLKSLEHKAVLSSFYSLPGFRAKLELANSCIKNTENVKFNSERWDNLYHQCSNKSGKRNFLAHSTTYYDHLNPKEQRRFFLSDGDSVDKRMYESDIAGIRDLFLALREELMKFWSDLCSEN